MEVKNLELPGYDPRGAFGMGLAYATSDRGGCHMRTYPGRPRRSSKARCRPTRSGQGRLGQSTPTVGGQNFIARQVQRHLVRLLGHRPRADRAAHQASLGARGLATRSSCGSASASGTWAACSICARASRRDTSLPQLYPRADAFAEGPVCGQGHRTRGVRGSAGRVLPPAWLGRERCADRGEAAELDIDVRL